MSVGPGSPLVVDASVLIAYLSPSDRWHGEAVELLAAERSHHVTITTPTLTLAEVLVGAVRADRRQPVIDALDTLGLTEHPGASSAMQLAELRHQTGLRMPDVVVLAAAEATGGRLATYDRRLAGTAAGRGVDVIGT